MAERDTVTAAEITPPDATPLRTRTDLVAALSRAVNYDLEHACACLYASASLKNDAREGGLTEEQAQRVRGWKRQLSAAGVRHLANFARLSERLRALGGNGTASRPALTVYRLSPQVLAKLAGTEPRGGPKPPYSAIEAALGDPANGCGSDGSVAALAEGDLDGADPAAGLADVAADYLACLAEAEQTGAPFEPVRPVVPNASVREVPPDGATVIADDPTRAVAELFNGAWTATLRQLSRLAAAGGTDQDEGAARTARQLVNSVVRPLAEALARMPSGGDPAAGTVAGPTFVDLAPADLMPLDHDGGDPLDERLWRLAVEATELRVRPGLPAEIQEATAAVQDVACRSNPTARATRIAELRAIQSGVAAGIQVETNGPYLVTNVENIQNWLGEQIETPPQVALCRCGGSATKPFCDGTHARIDFVDRKDPKRVPNRRDSYDGVQITVLDNRGLCAHSGFCTDRVSTVFRAGEEPFVAPSGGRMDEIVRAVRACPSGALSYAIDGEEAREQVDQSRPAGIEVSKDGPYRIVGSIPLAGGDGADVSRNTGASREHYSLCRCGQSQNKPFCSGMHWYVNFHDPVPPEDHEPTLFEWAGGFPALLRMTRLFYAKYVPTDPLLAPLFANMSSDHPERVAAWLGEVFGGPQQYTERYGGYARMVSQHIGKGLTEAHRARWASLMVQAANDAMLPTDAEFRAAFVAYVEWGSRIAVENSQTGARPPQGMSVPKWWWVCNATPTGRISALTPPVADDEPVVLPGDDEAVSFAQHVKPMFRSRDRQSMKFVFDLWSYDDVTQHAAAIAERLRSGSMPCDGAWPAERVRVFERWVDSGCPA